MSAQNEIELLNARSTIKDKSLRLTSHETKYLEGKIYARLERKTNQSINIQNQRKMFRTARLKDAL